MKEHKGSYDQENAKNVAIGKHWGVFSRIHF